MELPRTVGERLTTLRPGAVRVPGARLREHKLVSAARQAVQFLVLTLSACGELPPASEGVLDAELDGGDLVRATIPATDSAVLLVYDPDACFSCDGVLARWSNYTRTAEIPLYLVLSRQPLEAQRLQLMAYRVNIVGVLRRTPENATADAYLLRGDGELEVSKSALGVPAQAELLDSLAARALIAPP